MTAKTVTERVAKLRQERAKLGQTRIEIYAHPSDHAAIKSLALQLADQRKIGTMRNACRNVP